MQGYKLRKESNNTDLLHKLRRCMQCSRYPTLVKMMLWTFDYNTMSGVETDNGYYFECWGCGRGTSIYLTVKEAFERWNNENERIEDGK